MKKQFKYSRKEMVKEYEGAYGADTPFEIKFLSDLLATKHPKVDELFIDCRCHCHSVSEGGKPECLDCFENHRKPIDHLLATKQPKVEKCSICKGTHLVKDMDGNLTDFPCICQVAKEYHKEARPQLKIEPPIYEEDVFGFKRIVEKDMVRWAGDVTKFINLLNKQ